MASSPNYKRNYKRERDLQLKSAKSNKTANASRKAARRKLEAKGVVSKGDGKDVDHKNRNPIDNSTANLMAKPKSTNRSFSRKEDPKKYAKNLGASNPPTQVKFSKGGSTSTVNKANNYTNPTMRKNLFNSIKAGGKGGSPGQWSARKAQMLAKRYKAKGGGYT
jgi:hypothetical protein